MIHITNLVTFKRYCTVIKYITITVSCTLIIDSAAKGKGSYICVQKLITEPFFFLWSFNQVNDAHSGWRIKYSSTHSNTMHRLFIEVSPLPVHVHGLVPYQT